MKLSLPKYLPPQQLVNSLCPNFPMSEEIVRKIIKDSLSKSCSLDPLPTWLLKQCIDTLLPVITGIVNLSLSMATFPDNFKEAIPISNLHFISKKWKVVAMYVRDYMTANGLHDLLQSAYKKLHSTETALLCVQDALLRLLIITKMPFWCCF